MATSGDTFSFHKWRGGWYWHSWAGAQDVAKPLSLHRTALHYRELSGERSTDLGLRNLRIDALGLTGILWAKILLMFILNVYLEYF